MDEGYVCQGYTLRLLAFQVPVQPDFNFIDMCASLDPYSLFHNYFEQVMVFNEGDFPQAIAAHIIHSDTQHYGELTNITIETALF